MVWFHISAISQITKFNLGPMDFTKNYKPKKIKADFFEQSAKGTLTHLEKEYTILHSKCMCKGGECYYLPKRLKI
jgi:hypothetical protein